jgi:Glycosyl transferase family 2
MTGFIPITVAMIVRDEEQNLRELLPRLDFAKQIVVVVDDRTRDRSGEVAAQHGAWVVEREFRDFAAQRNWAIRAARHEWLLSIDADERPTASFVERLPELLAQSNFDAFRVPVSSTIFGRRFRFSGTQDDRPVRLFRRGRALWQGEVHERLAVDGRIGSVPQGLEHRTIPNLRAFLAKMDRYTRLEAARRVRLGLPASPWEPLLAPPREVFRRLVYKHGWLDGPKGWAFCLLSGLSAWELARRHSRAWALRAQALAPTVPGVEQAEHDFLAGSEAPMWNPRTSAMREVAAAEGAPST